mmetsp:Transcript_5190/g.12403  ORF Transcript_5190/g.12403 Transcript_5190/m.12403 type:complete len:127 (+) Transcript_5190:129-509(+)
MCGARGGQRAAAPVCTWPTLAALIQSVGVQQLNAVGGDLAATVPLQDSESPFYTTIPRNEKRYTRSLLGENVECGECEVCDGFRLDVHTHGRDETGDATDPRQTKPYALSTPTVVCEEVMQDGARP